MLHSYEPEKLLNRNVKRDFFRKLFLRSLISLAIAFTLYLATVTFLVFPVKVVSHAMKPNYEFDSTVYVSPRFSYASLAIGDVILIRHPYQKDKLFLSRIVGKAGDSIEIRNKKVLRNRQTLQLKTKVIHTDKRAALPTSISTRDRQKKAKVGAKQFYVLSDNRDEAFDSREMGAVPLEQVVGKVVF
ncbi:MAG: signal peptidase I [Spirochaetota bacterium]